MRGDVGHGVPPSAARRRSPTSARRPFDAVVSDMRMPGMDGAELLAQVHERCPQRRIILSGSHRAEDAHARAPQSPTSC